MAIIISERAKNELERLGTGGASFLRVSVVQGGCSGMTYSASIDSTLNENDQVVHQDGELRIVADPESTQYIDGLEVDFSDDLVQSGFQFKNAHATKSCGCGASFAV